jgi:cell division protein ZapA
MNSRAPAERTIQLDVTILGRATKVACKESEREELTEAVALLDARMREIRDHGKVTAIDRVAVMAALNLAHEALKAKRAAPAAPVSNTAATTPIDGGAAAGRIRSMHAAIDQVMAGQDKLF